MKKKRILKDERILNEVLNKQTKTKYDQVMTQSQITNLKHPIEKSRPSSRIKPRMYVRPSIMYENEAFC